MEFFYRPATKQLSRLVLSADPAQAPGMKVATIIARVLLGLIFVVFGSNAFLHFIPMPPMSGPAKDFIGSMYITGYLQVIAALQVIGGALLLIGRYVPLGLTLLGPIIVNIDLYHLFMDHSGLPLAILISALSLFLLWRHRDAFAGLVRP
jgi:putative oxidoreductase